MRTKLCKICGADYPAVRNQVTCSTKCSKINFIEIRKKYRNENKEHLNTVSKQTAKKYREINREKLNQQTKEWFARNPEKAKLLKNKTRLKYTYNITPEYYLNLVEQQNNLCAICNNPETAIDSRTEKIKNLAIDHSHVTGKVRGLLCSACNRALGYFKDSTEVLQNAINYLEKNND